MLAARACPCNHCFNKPQRKLIGALAFVLFLGVCNTPALDPAVIEVATLSTLLLPVHSSETRASDVVDLDRLAG
jgi:hypothetical protein